MPGDARDLLYRRLDWKPAAFLGVSSPFDYNFAAQQLRGPMQPAPATSIQAPISLLEKTPAILEILLRDLTNDLLERKPAPGRWSILEVLAHMNVIEALYKQRAKLIMLEHAPILPKFVPHSESEAHQKSAARQLEEFVTLRRAFVVYLHSIPAAAGSRTGEHHEMGTITLSQMLHELANHDLGHLRQVAELYRAYAFYPHAGPFQRYSNPKP